MRGSTRVKLELRNPRYPDRELKERLSELILYARYAGLDLGDFHLSITDAAIKPGQEGPEMRYGGRVVLTTNQKTSALINQIVKMYPVFSTWDIKEISAKKTSKAGRKTTTTKESTMATKKKAAKKKPAKKKAAKKKPAKKKVVKKKAAKKKAAKKKPAKKKAAKKKPAKKKAAKKKPAKKKAAKKKPAKKKAAKKKATKRKK